MMTTNDYDGLPDDASIVLAFSIEPCTRHHTLNELRPAWPALTYADVARVAAQAVRNGSLVKTPHGFYKRPTWVNEGWRAQV